METTLWSFLSLMPRTPRAVRPIALTFSSSKRTHLPSVVNNRISLLPSVISTLIKWSSSNKSKPITPFARTFLKLVNALFFTIPLAVAKKMYLSSSYSRTGRIAVILSSFSSGNRLTNGFPLAVRDAIGNS